MIRAAALAAKPSNRNAAPVAHLELRRGVATMAPELFGRALRLTRSQHLAEDLVQDTVERAIRFASTYREGTNLKAWMHQILFSVFITRCRRNRRERVAVGVLATDPNAWTRVDNVKEMPGLTKSTKRALRKLPTSFRRALVLVDLQELGYKEAAKKLRVPVGTIMSRLHRGRKMLAEIIREGEERGEEKMLEEMDLSQAA